MIGSLPLLFALAAISAPKTASLGAVLQQCLQPGNWKPHGFPPESSHRRKSNHSGCGKRLTPSDTAERGLVVTVYLDPKNPEHGSKESLVRLQEGRFGPFFSAQRPAGGAAPTYDTKSITTPHRPKTQGEPTVASTSAELRYRGEPTAGSPNPGGSSIPSPPGPNLSQIAVGAIAGIASSIWQSPSTRVTSQIESKQDPTKTSSVPTPGPVYIPEGSKSGSSRAKANVNLASKSKPAVDPTVHDPSPTHYRQNPKPGGIHKKADISLANMITRIRSLFAELGKLPKAASNQDYGHDSQYVEQSQRFQLWARDLEFYDDLAQDSLADRFRKLYNNRAQDSLDDRFRDAPR